MSQTVDYWLEYLNATLYASPRKDKAIEEAKLYVSKCIFGTSYNYALALWAAHSLALDNTNDGDDDDPNIIGNVKRQKEDKLEIEFHSSSGGNIGTDSWYRMTTYGNKFLALRKGNTIPVMTRLTNICTRRG